ncbi:MAG TPA: UTP--glucose-1-phosphate uridylyltransferase [Thermoleophilaceae bacterium]|nr:UTP--glucose-1-phosphate uridylyltransferase [Thermoleophilaceae bacterium]
MDGLSASVEKMRLEGVPEPAIDAFALYYGRLAEGEHGMLPESALEPVEDLPRSEDLPQGGAPAREALDQTVVIKLNGGLGTSMGMTQAKSLIEAKDGLSFLDLIARQLLSLRESTDGARLPLVLMNSFRTREASLAALEGYPQLSRDLPRDFLQGKVPKLTADEHQPVSWPADPELEWAPPGHGDIYTSLLTSGMLAALLEGGYRYAFVSNSDNLGAVLDPRILAWFAAEGLPFAMEVCERTEADRKGGHLARRREGGGLVLRESAQTPKEDMEALQQLGRHRFANTNNLWIDLRVLAATLDERSGVIELPMIVNRKTADPGDPSSPDVLQLETAMGAAIGVFEGAAALWVPRSRLAPVKTTNDLLTVRSDAYTLRDDSRVELVPGKPPFVDLDPDHYKLLAGFEERFPAGAPSLAACERLVVEGDVTFGRDVVVRGSVTVSGVSRVEDGTLLEG